MTADVLLPGKKYRRVSDFGAESMVEFVRRFGRLYLFCSPNTSASVGGMCVFSADRVSREITPYIK